MVTLNTAIRNAQIQEGIITPQHFDSVNTPSGSYIIKWNDDEGKFEWIKNGGITVNEIPSGTKNGVNTTFTLSATPLDGTEQIYLNGLLQEPGSSNDYTISGNTITFTEAPLSDDIILATYVTAQAFGYEDSTPPPTPSYGYFIGGNSISSIDRILFPFDSGTATHIGNLSGTKYDLAGHNSSQYGYASGGYYDGNYLSVIDRFQFPFDSGTATNVGSLSVTSQGVTGCNSSSHGYSLGGYYYSSVDRYLSNIDRILFPFNSGTANHVGNLSGSRKKASSLNCSIYGYCNGGIGSIWDQPFSIIDRFQFPFDSGTASNVGNLAPYDFYNGVEATAGCNSSEYGFILGGIAPADVDGWFSIIQRIQFPFNSGTASNVGNLSSTRYDLAGVNSTNYGYSGGGFYSGSVSIVDRIQFPFNSGTASNVGNLSSNKRQLAGVDNTDFVSMFV